MPYSLIIDLFVAVLLVVTIGYAIVLNKRLGKLRRDESSLEKLAATFGDSTVRAEESIETLKYAADMIQERMDKAQALRDDLAFLIDRGSQAADNLEDLVRASRDIPRAEPRPGPVEVPGSFQEVPLVTTPVEELPAEEEEEEFKSEAERELLKAIRTAG